MLGVKVCLHLPHYIPSYVSVALFFYFLSHSHLPRSLSLSVPGLCLSSALCLECINTQEQVYAPFRTDLRMT